MTEERLRVALEGLRVRVPASPADAEALRAEVRAADRALGELLRRSTTAQGAES